MNMQSLRPDLRTALDSFEREAFKTDWTGNTYAAYWDWFNSQSDAIEAMAVDQAERYAIEGLLLEMRDSAHEQYGVPDDRAGDTIGAPSDDDAMVAEWAAVDRTLRDADEFLGNYNKAGKTFRNFWDEFDARYPGIWQLPDKEGAPYWVRPAVDTLAVNSSGFSPERANVDIDDLMVPGDARAGRYDEDLKAALDTIESLPELRSLDAEAVVHRQYDRLVHYHPQHSDAAHEAIRLHVQSLRSTRNG